MLFSWNNGNGKKQTHKVSLKGDAEELRELNYYIPEGDDTDELTFIAFMIAPTKANEFTMYTKSYDENSYVTVEVRDGDQFVVRRNLVFCAAFIFMSSLSKLTFIINPHTGSA